jgi:hypothetical protein
MGVFGKQKHTRDWRISGLADKQLELAGAGFF